jgi:nucleotide-binding universal stress UspA family protein
MDKKITLNTMQAVQDFRSARQKATLREIIARFTGESTELLSFEEVRQKLKAQVGPQKVLKEISINAIIGSVNRYQDFSRDFLPGQNIDEERWANVELANYTMVGLPPIEVYQIDEVYFVSDGNHRVSVARQLGSDQIQAYVTVVHTRVPFTADVRPEDLILKSEYIEFLEYTNLDQVRPELNLSVTVPGQYELIEEHVAVHRYFMGIEQQREIPVSEAAADWYDKVYLPVVNIIQERGLLIDFPTRTETDLYLWIAEHRAALEEDLKSQIEITSAADDLADQYSQRPYRVIARLENKIVKALVPNMLEAGPAPGEWRQSILSTHRFDRLFCEILVPINGHEDGWCALEQAFVVAKREETNIHGLYILATDGEPESQATQYIQNEFTNRCEAIGIKSDLQVKIGDVPLIICERARWNDLVVMNLTHPPESSMLARLSSGIRNLVQRCPRPILFTPQVTKPLQHALLAYDGSLKAQEALFIATYLAGKWKIPLEVISIGDENIIKDIQDDARKYLEDHDVRAEYIVSGENNHAELILQYVDQLNIDLLLLGGYSRNPILEVIQGGDVDQILRQTNKPILICR